MCWHNNLQFALNNILLVFPPLLFQLYFYPPTILNPIAIDNSETVHVRLNIIVQQADCLLPSLLIPSQTILPQCSHKAFLYLHMDPKILLILFRRFAALHNLHLQNSFTDLFTSSSTFLSKRTLSPRFMPSNRFGF